MKQKPTPLARVLYAYVELKQLGIPWSRPHINNLIRKGEFPAPLEISPNRLVWPASEIMEFVDNLPRRRKPNLLGHNGGPPLEDDDRDAETRKRLRERVRLND